MIIHLLICPLVQVSVSPFVLSLVGPSVNPRQRLVTRLKKTRPLRGTHRTRKLRVALENACVFMEQEERKEEEEVEEEDD